MAATCLVVSIPTTNLSIQSIRTTTRKSSRVSVAGARENFRGSSALLAYRVHITGTDAITTPVLRIRSTRATRAYVVASSESKSVLIVNTNSGGHAVIGFWVAQALTKNGHKVTVLTVGKEDSDKMKKPPFSRFAELRDMGVTTVWGEPSDVAASVGSAQFEVVLDNNGKDLDTVKPVVEWAKANGCSQFLFMSSAGIYKNSDQQPLVEGDAVKGDAGHVEVEQYLATAVGSNWASFRPQYITGPGNNKDCEEWFFDRIVRDRPVPIPGSGMQMTVIAPVQDMASMVAAAVEDPSASAGGVFNCVGDRGVSFDGLVRMCAKAAGSKAEIVHYDPKAVGVDVKKAFPFRNQHFYSEPRAAKEKLGWQPKLNLQDVLNDRFEEYIKSGRHTKNMKFEIDDVILAATGAAVPAPVAA